MKDELRDESGIVTIVPARMNSHRLPGKPLLPLGDATVLEQVIRRIRAARFGACLVVATSGDPSDQPIREFCAARAIPCFAGSLQDVLERTIRTAKVWRAKWIVYCRASHPLLEPKMLDACARYTLDSGMDYITVARLPLGVGAEGMPVKTLWRTAALTRDPADREQATAFPATHPDLFEGALLPPPPRLSRPDIRLTLETEADYQVLTRLYAEVAPHTNGLIRVEDVIAYMDANPELRLHGKPPFPTTQAA